MAPKVDFPFSIICIICPEFEDVFRQQQDTGTIWFLVEMFQESFD